MNGISCCHSIKNAMLQNYFVMYGQAFWKHWSRLFIEWILILYIFYIANPKFLASKNQIIHFANFEWYNDDFFLDSLLSSVDFWSILFLSSGRWITEIQTTCMILRHFLLRWVLKCIFGNLASCDNAKKDNPHSTMRSIFCSFVSSHSWNMFTVFGFQL